MALAEAMASITNVTVMKLKYKDRRHMAFSKWLPQQT
jgi:hypothetical protein